MAAVMIKSFNPNTAAINTSIMDNCQNIKLVGTSDFDMIFSHQCKTMHLNLYQSLEKKSNNWKCNRLYEGQIYLN